MVCFLCRHTDHDIDLTDPECRKTLTFQSAVSTAITAECLCDLCEAFLRYQLGSRSRSELRKKLECPDRKLKLLSQLAWY